MNNKHSELLTEQKESFLFPIRIAFWNTEIYLITSKNLNISRGNFALQKAS